MEEDQELKHACKFCSKSFPNGRSLGGHMRSHIVTTNVVSSETEKSSATATTMKKKKKLSISLNTTEKSESVGGGAGAGYGLRENPKKTWRLTDSSNEDHTLVLDKLCKECGKGFQSWKALFGHMKCHSEKERVVSVSNNNNNDNTCSLEDQDSWTNNNCSSQSDTEEASTTTVFPNRRRRSKRRRTSSSVVSFASNPPNTFSVSEAELEQEEVAMSLMMLSRDVGPWCGVLNSNSINAIAESSNNNNSMLFHLEDAQAPPIINLVNSKIEGKRPISNGSSEMEKVTKQKDNNKWEFGNSVSSNLNSKGKKSSELLATKLDSESAAFEFDLSNSATTTKYTSIKAKFCGSELRSTSSLRNMVNKPSEGEVSRKNSSHKRSKFECTTCNKSFHSYQALGGHRASHKRIKGFLASNSIKLEAEELSPDPTTEESKLIMKDNTDNNEYVEEHVVHLQEEAVPEMRDFLDLNLPAAASEEESNTITHAVETCNRPWWVVGSNHNHNHKQEALIGLLSN